MTSNGGQPDSNDSPEPATEVLPMADPPEDNSLWAEAAHELVAVSETNGLGVAIGNGSMAEWIRFEPDRTKQREMSELMKVEP